VLRDSAFQDGARVARRGEVIYALTRGLSDDQRTWFELQGVRQ
jgi:hypothetical protein